MAIDPFDPELFPVVQLGRHVRLKTRRGNAIHSTTAWRWTTKGVKGVKLAFMMIGGMRYTSRDAVREFFAKLSGQPLPKPENTAKRLAREEAELAALGV